MRNQLNQGKGYILCHIRKVTENSSEEIEPIASSEDQFVVNTLNFNSCNFNSSNMHERKIIIEDKANQTLKNEIFQSNRIKSEINEGYKEFSKSLSILSFQYRFPNGELDFFKIFSYLNK